MLEEQQKHNNIKPIVIQEITKDLISVLCNEAEAINYLIKNFPSRAEILVKKILQTKGRVVFCGMGKSGLVAKKLVATFSSIGIPSLFLHPSEALHGDLGMVQHEDLFIAISKSGTGLELEQILPLLISQEIFTSLICCGKGKLSEIVDLTIVLPFKQEACQMNLAPTSSSTICMAFGDALAVVVSKLKGFGKNDFAKFHPSGALGKRLLLKISSLMSKNEQLPLIYADMKFKDFMFIITSKKLGVGIVVDDNEKLLGIITDGDLRRACELGPQVFDKNAFDIMISNPKVVNENILAYDALQFMENFNITSLVVTKENNKVVGLIHIHDLLKAGITSK